MIDISEVTCFIGIPSIDSKVDIEFMNGIIMAMQAGMNFEFGEQTGISIVQHARNMIVDGFLKKSKAQKLIFIDTDIGFNGQDLLKLIAMSTLYPVAAGLYRTKNDVVRYTANPVINPETRKVVQNEYGHIQMHSMPLGFSIIDRKVFEKFSGFPKYKNHVTGELMTEYFRVYIDNEHLIGEDMDFCNQCYTNGIGMWCDPTINLNHFGRTSYSGTFIDALKSDNLLEG